VASVQVGRCACGNPGKPLATIQSGTGYVCLSCLIREAMGTRTPLTVRARTDMAMPARAEDAKSFRKQEKNSK
jgi:hypothetical protein